MVPKVLNFALDTYFRLYAWFFYLLALHFTLIILWILGVYFWLDLEVYEEWKRLVDEQEKERRRTTEVEPGLIKTIWVIYQEWKKLKKELKDKDEEDQ